MYTFEPDDNPRGNFQWSFEPQEDPVGKEASRTTSEEAPAPHSPGWLTWMGGGGNGGATGNSSRLTHPASPNRSRETPPPVPIMETSWLSSEQGQLQTKSRNSNEGSSAHLRSASRDSEFRMLSRDPEPKTFASSCSAVHRGRASSPGLGTVVPTSSSRSPRVTLGSSTVVHGNYSAGRSFMGADVNKGWTGHSPANEPSGTPCGSQSALSGRAYDHPTRPTAHESNASEPGPGEVETEVETWNRIPLGLDSRGRTKSREPPATPQPLPTAAVPASGHGTSVATPKVMCERDPRPEVDGDEDARSEAAPDAVHVLCPWLARLATQWGQAARPQGAGSEGALRPGGTSKPSVSSEHEAAGHPLHHRLMMKFAQQGSHCPCRCASLGLLVVIAVVGVGMALKPPSVETNFDAFMKTDVNTSTMRDTFLYALQKRQADRRLQAMLFKHYDMSIVYDLKEGVGSSRGIFDVEILSGIARFEQKLRSLPLWKELCELSELHDRRFCETGISFISYAFPSLTVQDGHVVPSSLKFDGLGRDRVPLHTALLLTEELQIADVLLPSDFSFQDRTSRQLRSVFRFKFMCCTSMDSMAYQRQVVGELNVKWKAFTQGVLIPKLQKAARGIDMEGVWDQNPPPVNIYYDGAGFEGFEVMQTLGRDAKLAGGSVGFVLLYMLVHTRSILLSVMGLLIIALSVPLSYVLFALSTGSQTMSIASALSLFLIVGLGSDVVFVYADFWNESKFVKDHHVERLTWTLWHAGKASFATTTTTALSFLANLASVLKPLREFGFFMGLCVVLVWVLVTLIFLPLCIVNENCVACMRRRSAPSRCLRCCRRPESPSERRRWTPAFFDWWTGHLYRWRRTIVITTALCCVIATAWAASTVTTDTGVPNLFPDGHNQNQGKEVIRGFPALNEVFDPFFMPLRESTEVCSEQDFRSTSSASCSLYWCEARPDVPISQDGQCKCFRKRKPQSCYAGEAHVAQHYVGVAPSDDDLQGPIGDFLVSGTGDHLHFRADNDRLGALTRTDVPGPMVLQEWESGDVMIKTMTRVEAVLTRENRHASCGWEDLCFCGAYVCKLPAEWVPTAHLQLATQRRLVAQPQWQVPSNMRAIVEVIFGLEVSAESPLLGEVDLSVSWSFNKDHDIRQPWAQRNLYYFCKNLPAELLITSQRCWIADFRNYALSHRLRFPVPRDQFDQHIIRFSKNYLTGISSSQEFLWVRNDEVKASFMSFNIDVQKHAATRVALEHKRKWDAYLDHYNGEASRFARDAWHTSGLWVRAEAQSKLIMSTAVTLLIVILLAFLGMLVFTRDGALSLFVVAATCGVVAGLFFFITVLMGWPIGPIEVIALIVFIGYAVTYSLHIAHRYGSKDALSGGELYGRLSRLDTHAGTRYRRTLFALQTIGGAALGSAVTTAGSSIFLIFCTLTIFQKLGGVVLAVTIMSILMALGPLATALLMIGPVHPGSLVPRCEACCSHFHEARDAISALCQKWSAPEDTREDRLASVESPGAGSQRESAGGHSAHSSTAQKDGGGASTGKRLSKLSEMDFDIGTESPLECIWAREAGGVVRSVEGHRAGEAPTAAL